MTTANKTRSNIFRMAWSFKRSEPTRVFAECLRSAWAWTKRMAKTAAKFAAKARRSGGWVHLSPSLIRSPSTNHYAGRTYGRTYDRKAGSSISRVGR